MIGRQALMHITSILVELSPGIFAWDPVCSCEVCVKQECRGMLLLYTYNEVDNKLAFIVSLFLTHEITLVCV